MNKNFRNRVLIFSSFALIGLVTFISGFEFISAQGAVPKPSNTWIFDAKGVSSQRISDKAGRFSGKTIGVPSFKQLDAHSFHEFHGTDGFLLKENATGAEPGMPHEFESMKAPPTEASLAVSKTMAITKKAGSLATITTNSPSL
jgi:hypothetical protein